MAIQTRGQAVHKANLGLYFDRPPLLVPERGLSFGQNFRIHNGQITNRNVGWSSFNSLNLDGRPVTLIEQFTPNGGTTKTIFGNTTDLFQYNGAVMTYITPRYGTGTVAVTNGSPNVVGTGTAWLTNTKIGDYFSAAGANYVTVNSANWYRVLNVVDDTHITLASNYTGSTTSGIPYTIRKTFTGTIFLPWFTETFRNGSALGSGTGSDRWYATNGINAVIAWDGVADQVYTPSLGNITTCKFLRRYKNVMIFVAPSESGTLKGQNIRSSAIGQPENVATLEAASFIISDSSETLTSAHQIGELLAIYSPKDIFLAQYVGSPIMYVFRSAVRGYGPRGGRSVIRFPSFHLFFGSDGMYQFDGAQASQTSTHVWKEITRASSPSRAALVQGFIAEADAELLWVTPLNSDSDPAAGPPAKAYVGHYLEDVGQNPMPHSTRDLPATAIGTYVQGTTLTFDQMILQWNQYSIQFDDQQAQAGFPQILFGTNAGDIMALNSQNQLSVVPTCYVRFARRPLIDSRANGVVHRIYANADFQPGSTSRMSIVLRLFDAPNDTTPASTAEYDITLDGTNRFAPFRNSGRFSEIEFGSGPTVSGTWALEGYDMDVIRGAER